MTVISNVFIVLGIIFNYDANGVSDFNVHVWFAFDMFSRTWDGWRHQHILL